MNEGTASLLVNGQVLRGAVQSKAFYRHEEGGSRRLLAKGKIFFRSGHLLFGGMDMGGGILLCR